MYGSDWLNNTKLVVDIGNHALFLAYSLLMGLFFGRLACPFLNDNRRKAGVSGIIYAAFMLYNTWFPFDLPRGVGSVIRIVAGFVILYLLDRTRPRQKIFVSILFYTIATLCMQLNAEQGMYMNDIIFDVLPFNTTPERTVILYLVCILEDAVFYGISIGVGVFLSKKIICQFDEEISARDLLLLALPFLMIFVQIWVYSDNYDLYTKYFMLLDDVGDKDTLQQLSYNSMPRLINMLLYYVFIPVFLWCFFDIKKISRENVNAAILSEQTAALQSHVKKMDEMYGEIRSIRHDMNHHMEVMSSLLDEGKGDEAREYLSSMQEFVKDVKPAFSTGNPVTDIIISERADEAEKEGIDFESSFSYPSDFGFDIFDISGILGNAFSNAFAACKSVSDDLTPYIRVTSVTKKNFYLIEMVNSYEGILSIDSETGLPVSKSPEVGHGIGMTNMQKLARKYNGDVTVKQSGYEVIVSVIMQKKRMDDSGNE